MGNAGPPSLILLTLCSFPTPRGLRPSGLTRLPARRDCLAALLSYRVVRASRGFYVFFANLRLDFSSASLLRLTFLTLDWFRMRSFRVLLLDISITSVSVGPAGFDPALASNTGLLAVPSRHTLPAYVPQNHCGAGAGCQLGDSIGWAPG